MSLYEKIMQQQKDREARQAEINKMNYGQALQSLTKSEKSRQKPNYKPLNLNQFLKQEGASSDPNVPVLAFQAQSVQDVRVPKPVDLSKITSSDQLKRSQKATAEREFLKQTTAYQKLNKAQPETQQTTIAREGARGQTKEEAIIPEIPNINPVGRVVMPVFETTMSEQTYQNANWLIENKKGSFKPHENESQWGYVYPKGLTITVEGGGGGVRDKIPALCTDCKISPEAQKYLTSINYGQMSTHGYVELKKEKLRELRIINDKGTYVPYDDNWIEQFPELKKPAEPVGRVEIPLVNQGKPDEIIFSDTGFWKPEQVPEQVPEPKNNKLLILGGLAALAIVGFFVIRRMKK